MFKNNFQESNFSQDQQFCWIANDRLLRDWDFLLVIFFVMKLKTREAIL